MSSLLTNHCMREIPILRAFISAERCRKTALNLQLIPLCWKEDDAWVKKTEWLKSHNLVVMRCHDVWDDFPEIGIHGAWAKWLGFEDPPVSSQKFYEVHKVDNLTLQQVAENIAAKVKNLGQECVHFIVGSDQAVTRIALGTGAITSYRVMVHMGADCLLLTDDGTRLWESGQWAEDTGIGLIVVNHATSEEPGVRALAQYLQNNFLIFRSDDRTGNCTTQPNKEVEKT